MPPLQTPVPSPVVLKAQIMYQRAYEGRYHAYSLHLSLIGISDALDEYPSWRKPWQVPDNPPKLLARGPSYLGTGDSATTISPHELFELHKAAVPLVIEATPTSSLESPVPYDMSPISMHNLDQTVYLPASEHTIDAPSISLQSPISDEELLVCDAIMVIANTGPGMNPDPQALESLAYRLSGKWWCRYPGCGVSDSRKDRTIQHVVAEHFGRRFSCSVWYVIPSRHSLNAHNNRF